MKYQFRVYTEEGRSYSKVVELPVTVNPGFEIKDMMGYIGFYKVFEFKYPDEFIVIPREAIIKYEYREL